MLKKSIVFAGMLIAAGATAAGAQEDPFSAPAYADLASAAKSEGKVTVYTSTDAAQAQGVIDGFQKRFGIQVDYVDLGTNGAYSRFVSEAAAGQVTADVVWSSAMSLQVSLAADGYGQDFQAIEKPNIPEWADYNDTLFATTVEPIGILYNKGALPDGVPKNRKDLVQFLTANADKLSGKIATFDPEKSGGALEYHTNDIANTDNFWDFARAMGSLHVKPYSSTGSIRETVVSGENVLATNIIGSYALEWVKTTPNLGVEFGDDYTAAFSRVAMVAKDAPHPNAGQLFVNYLLSSEGQNALAAKGLPSVRDDVTEGLNVKTLPQVVGANLKPIALDDHLLEYLDPQKRVEFLKEWKSAIAR